MQTQQTTEKKPWKMKLAISAAVFILLAVIFELVGKTPTSEKNNPTGNGPGERRAVPAPMIETEAPLPLQIDTNAPAKVTVRTNISLK